MNQRENKKPFSRLIILAGIAVSILFIILAFIPVQKSNRHSSPMSRSKAQVQSLALGAVVFAGNHEDRLPTAEEWPEALIEPGIIEPEWLVSQAEDGDGLSFVYVPSSHKLFEGDFDNRILIYEDPNHFEEGVVVGFLHFRVEVIEHDEFERMLAEQLALEPQNPDSETP